VPSQCTIVRAVGGSAYALQRVYGRNGDKNSKHQRIGAASTVELYLISVKWSPDV
jgi:hypothetical protein